MSDNGWLCCPDTQSMARGRYRATRNASVPLPNPQSKSDMAALMGYARTNNGSYQNASYGMDPFRSWWDVGEGIDNVPVDKRRQMIDHYMSLTNFDENLMRISPAEWPEVVIQVHHYAKNSRMFSLCLLSIFDPMTGARTTLPFTCYGTTLRGARQQRIPGTANGGWSTYNNANPQQIILGPSLDWATTRTIAW